MPEAAPAVVAAAQVRIFVKIITMLNKMRNQKIRAALFLFALILLFASAQLFYFVLIQTGKTSPTDAKPNFGQVVAESEKLAIDFTLRRKIPSTGLFVYDLDAIALKTSLKDIFVRQAGTLYELSLFINKDKRVLPELEDSLNKIYKHLYLTENAGKKFALFDYYDYNNLGSVAMIYMAYLNVEHIDKKWADRHPNFRYLFNTIGFAQNPDGSFKDYVHKDSEKIKNIKSSGYSTGEALVALIYHIKYKKKSERALDMLNKAVAYLEKRGSGKMFKGLYLWLMRAGYMAQSLESLPLQSKKRLTEFAQNYHLAMRDKLIFVSDRHNTCSHAEGLGHYILMSQKLNYNDLEGEISVYLRALNNNLKLQVSENNIKSILSSSEDSGLKLANLKHKYIYGGFLDSLDKMGTRIDYTQHCLSQLKEYDLIFSK